LSKAENGEERPEDRVNGSGADSGLNSSLKPNNTLIDIGTIFFADKFDRVSHKLVQFYSKLKNLATPLGIILGKLLKKN